jgi:hypothetical protein
VAVTANDPPGTAEASPELDHLVILVHGINTRALWMSEVKPVLEREGFWVAQTSYGEFGVPRFLSPFTSMRERAINRVLTDIRTARQAFKMDRGKEPEKMSVISHSFGTHVVSKILTDAPDLEWFRVIFCGSVVREDFPLHLVMKRFRPPLLNEIGTKDYWPAVAESAGWGYGSVGSTGFNRPPVESRWHKGFGHSDFLTEDFCSEFWIDFLKGSKPKPGDKATRLPLWIRMIASFPLRWVIALLIVSPLFVGAIWIAEPELLINEFRHPWSHVPARSGTASSTPSKTAEPMPSTAQSMPAAPAPSPQTPTQEDPSDSLKQYTSPFWALEGRWLSQADGNALFIEKTSGGYNLTDSARGQMKLFAIEDSGSDIIKLSNSKSTCLYSVLFISPDRMAWDFRSGAKACMPSTILDRAIRIVP